MYLEDLIIFQLHHSFISQDIQEIIFLWWILKVPRCFLCMWIETCELIPSSLDAKLFIPKDEEIHIVYDTFPSWFKVIHTDSILSHTE